ncbi:MAG: hypothetical protein ACLR17_13630 [Enterobacteriaceae bacterium]
MEVIASEQDYRATIPSTIDTTAQLYWNIALLNQQMTYQAASLDVAGRRWRRLSPGSERESGPARCCRRGRRSSAGRISC